MKKFITFGGPSERFHNNVNRICKEAENLQFFDEIKGFTEKDLINDTVFWNKHKDFILNNSRGFGYWIWKSYLINRELEKMNENDILIYTDSGCKLNHNGKQRLLEYISLLNTDPNDYGIISFQLPFKEYQYTKKQIFDYFLNGSDIHEKTQMENSIQCVGGIQIIRKTEHSSKIVKLWSLITQHYFLINDNITNNEHPGFIENRHDQSIYSVLVNKFGSIKIKDETYFENPDESKKYPILALRL